MITNLRQIFRPLASLRLTLVCLACAMVLIFAGTLDQVHIGVFEAQNRYFKSFLLYYNPPGTAWRIPWFPGGYVVGGVLLLNLIVAHFARFKLTWRKLGIIILHSGLILLLVGQLSTSLFQVESQMRLDQGQTRNYSEDFFHDELALIDGSAPDADQVIAIPFSRLRPGTEIKLPVAELTVSVQQVYPNSALINPSQLPSANYPHLKLGPMAVAVPIERTYKQDERNLPTVALAIRNPGGVLGAWNLAAGFPQPVRFSAGGKPFEMVLRPRRIYRPFNVQLLEFRHDRYAGTDIPKNFSSRIRLTDPVNHADRESLIFMNHPLRYAGLTFYQAGFDNNDRTTVLQVVQNPSWLIPYISCALLAFGLLVQFGMHLSNFMRHRVLA